MPFKSLRDILEEHGVETTQEEREPMIDWQEPSQPQWRWLTLADLFSQGGNLIALLAAIVQYFIAISIWSMVAIILLLVILRILGCQ